MNTKKEKDEYYTSDLNICAYLECAQVEFLRMERACDTDGNPSRRVILFYRKGPGHDKLLNEYFNRKGKVSASEFADNLKNLKSRIYSV